MINYGDNFYFWDGGCEIICFFLALGIFFLKKLERELYGDNYIIYLFLVIVFGFGFLFFCVVVVLIGCFWWFVFYRLRYFKVDYLMNGF